MYRIIFLIFLFSGNCLYGQNNTTNILCGEWKLCYGPYNKNGPETLDELKNSNWPVIPATVPGNVELDLSNKNNIISYLVVGMLCY